MRGSSPSADAGDFFLEGEGGEAGERQAQEQSDAAVQGYKSIAKGALHLFKGAHDRSGVGNTPMGGNRLARPERTNFRCGIVADRKNKIHLRGAGLGKFVPTLAAQTVHG